MTVAALVGAQYGSEGKGAVAQYLAHDYDIWVRTGGPNAGHTIYHGNEQFKMQSIPCGWLNPEAQLIIGPGAVVDLHHLLHELEDVEARSGMAVRNRLIVDQRAALIDPIRHRNYEGGISGEAHARIGSTGEGVGITRMARINRESLVRDLAWGRLELAGDRWADFGKSGIVVADTVSTVNYAIDDGQDVMLEGTQGSGLSLIHGPWPYATSADTNAAQLAADAGIAPALVTDVILVARTFPIRVAGNSGPLAVETDWNTIGVPEEKTTVTKKVRRVGMWESDVVRKAAMLNRPKWAALMFLDYLWPEISGKTSTFGLPVMAGADLYQYVNSMEGDLGAPIRFLGTGPQTLIDLEAEALSPQAVA